MRRALPALPALLVAIFALPPLPAAGETAAGPWYNRLLVGMEVGPTGAQFGSDASDVKYAEKFSGTDIVAAQIATGSQYIVIWGKDGEYAYYNSKVAPKCPGLGDRDVIRETVEAAKPHNLPVIVYCVVQAGGYPLRQHPEFKMRDVEGKPIERVCLNSGFMGHLKDLVDEMLAYGIQGFHIDMLDQGFGPPYGCWCDNCRARFERDYGKPMPASISWDEAWDRMLEFRYNTCERFQREILAHIKERQPDCSVDFNYHGNPPFSFEIGQRPVQHAHIGDFVTGECGTWGFGALSPSFEALFVRGTDPAAPFQVVIQRGVRMYHDQTTRPLEDMRWEMFSLLMHGAQVTIVDKTPFDGSLDRVAYERYGALFREALAKQEHFGRQHRPLADVGLFFSHRTRDWYARETPRKYFDPVYGAHEAVVLGHLPAEFVFDERLTGERLRRHRVVYAPGAAILEPETVALLEDYVRGGGKLLVTGDTGTHDRMGAPRAESALANLIGAKLVRRLDTDDNHVSFPADGGDLDALAAGIPRDWPFLARGAAGIYEPTTARPFGTLHRPFRSVLQQQGKEGFFLPQSPEEAVGPAILVNDFGKGRVVCIAAAPDTAIGGEFGMPEDRMLIENALRLLDPDPPVRVDAPRFVESAVTAGPEPDTLRVHLVAHVTPPQNTHKDRPLAIPAFIEDKPIYRVSVKVAGGVKEIEAATPTTTVTPAPGGFTAQVEDIHEVFVIRTK